MPLSDEERAKYDAAQGEARKALEPIVAEYPEAIEAVANWLKANIAAGHKRLGRILYDLAS